MKIQPDLKPIDLDDKCIGSPDFLLQYMSSIKNIYRFDSSAYNKFLNLFIMQLFFCEYSELKKMFETMEKQKVQDIANLPQD